MDSSDKEIVFTVAEKLIGVSQQGQYRKDIIVRNVERRMKNLGVTSFLNYLEFAQKNSNELSRLVSSLTIHTTSWFRELPHFTFMKEHFEANVDKYKGRKLRALSIACSTGEEVYSMAMVLEGIRSRNIGFDYEVTGLDIDPESIKVGKNGVYLKTYIDDIPTQCRKFAKEGQGKLAEYFAVTQEVRKRCNFKVRSLADAEFCNNERFDLIFCRNVLIYFSPENFEKIVRRLSALLTETGILTLGHSEALISPKIYNLVVAWNSSYKSHSADILPARPTISKKLNINSSSLGQVEKVEDLSKDKILVIDDSRTIRTILSKLFTTKGYSVLLASTAQEASDILKSTKVSLISLDIHMPGENGNVWLKRQRLLGVKTPVIIVTDANVEESKDVLDALENGAQDYIKKSKLEREPEDVVERFGLLIKESKRIKDAKVTGTHSKKYLKLYRPELILVGASTGGTEALTKLLAGFRKDSPPVLVVQHISPNFALPFAMRLSDVSGLTLGEYSNGTILKKGCLYMSHGNTHVGVKYVAGTYKLVVSDLPPRSGHRPSVDVLFDSAVRENVRLAGVLLTGMGKDGSAGLLQLKKKGAMTFVQDEASCVVFGMPGAAISTGADCYVGNISEIRNQLNKCLQA